MTQSIYTNWDTSWTATSIASSTITNTGNAVTSSAISNDNKSGTEVSITVAYGSTATQGLDVYICRDVNGTFESETDRPFGFQMPYSPSTTYYRTIIVMAERVSQFKVKVINNSGSSVTATVSFKQSVINVV